MRRLLMIGWGVLLFICASSTADAQQATNPIASLVGYWDLPGTTIRLKIHPDGTVDHSVLGEGTIRFDEINYYRLVFRHRYLTCQYEVRKYSNSELTFTISVQPSEASCELGALRRSPGSPVPEPKGKSSESTAGTTVAAAEETTQPKQGVPFKDCEDCPEMVALPTGRYAVTRDQYDAFVKSTGRLYEDGCQAEAAGKWTIRPDLTFRNTGFPQDGRHPVVCVNWEDASSFAKWLSAKTGKRYRLLTEAEREFAARAGTSSAYWWGNTVRSDLANYEKPLQQPTTEANKAQAASMTKTGPPQNPQFGQSGGTVPVHLYQPNPWGLFQVHGNVAEWAEDCWNRSYMGAPTTSSAAKTGDCDRRVLRGGGWSYRATDVRAAYRESARKESRYVHVGFRVARDFD